MNKVQESLDIQGILPVLQNFDALAFVLGHEVGHVLARFVLCVGDNIFRHAAERLTLVKVLLLLNDVLASGAYIPWIFTAILSQCVIFLLLINWVKVERFGFFSKDGIGGRFYRVISYG